MARAWKKQSGGERGWKLGLVGLWSRARTLHTPLCVFRLHPWGRRAESAPHGRHCRLWTVPAWGGRQTEASTSRPWPRDDGSLVVFLFGLWPGQNADSKHEKFLTRPHPSLRPSPRRRALPHSHISVDSSQNADTPNAGRLLHRPRRGVGSPDADAANRLWRAASPRPHRCRPRRGRQAGVLEARWAGCTLGVLEGAALCSSVARRAAL